MALAAASMMPTSMTQASSPSSEATHILDDIFTLCRIPFVHDFMFTSDPVADISILTAPVQKEHAIAARLTVSGSEVGASFAHVFDFSTDLLFCSIPAFSVGAVSVGFAILEPAGSSHSALHELSDGADSVQCNRFVRDDERGVFFMLSHKPSGVTEVDCMSHRSTRRRTRVCARFRSADLRQRLRSPRGVLHPADLAHALTYLNVSYERRACPMCRAADEGECGCVLPFVRPSHPLDFRNEQGNMRLHTGLYQGGCTVRLYNNCLPYVITNLATRSVITGSVDPKVIARLNKYAVQLRMAELNAGPLIMGAPQSAQPSRKGDALDAHTKRTTPSTKGPEFAVADLAVPQPDESFLQDSAAITAPTFSSFSLGGLLEGPVPLIGGPVGVGTVLMDTGGPQPPASRSSPSTRHSERETARNMSGDSSVAELQTSGVQGAQGNVNVVELEPEDPMQVVGSVSGSSQQGNLHMAGSGSGSSERSAGLGVGNKQLKTELRKQRNRAAAARSNVKRKIRNETLRRNLKEVHQRANELRAQERRLREENVRLRVEATKHQLKVGPQLQHIQIPIK